MSVRWVEKMKGEKKKGKKRWRKEDETKRKKDEQKSSGSRPPPTPSLNDHMSARTAKGESLPCCDDHTRPGTTPASSAVDASGRDAVFPCQRG